MWSEAFILIRLTPNPINTRSENMTAGISKGFMRSKGWIGLTPKIGLNQETRHSSEISADAKKMHSLIDNWNKKDVSEEKK